MSARYDGLAECYDENLASFTLAATGVLERLLGGGPGSCLDLCCGTGLHLPTLTRLGWTVTGVDISADQLRFYGPHSLEKLLGAFLDAGLVLDRFEEHGEGDYPPRVALRAHR